MQHHSKLPWRITEANEKKTREIVAADGSTVARLTALDMENAELIVKGVNLLCTEMSFEDWWNEIEGFAMRAERFTTPQEAAKAAWDARLSFKGCK